MKRLISALFAVVLTMTAIAQNSRLVRGYVQDEAGEPMAGVLVSGVGNEEQATSDEKGSFEIRVSPYTQYLTANFEGYLSAEVEIDASVVVIRMKYDKRYNERKKLAEEQARQAAQMELEAKKEAEHQARIAAEKEKEAKAKAAEQARIAAEKEAEAKAKAAEQARIAAAKEAEAKAKAAEQARIAAAKEAEAKAKAAEQARIAALKKAEKEERDRLAKIARQKRIEEIRKQSRGFGSMVDVSYQQAGGDPYAGMGFTYTAGYRFNNLVYLGIGAGVDFNFNGEASTRSVDSEYLNTLLTPAQLSVPVFVYFKSNFINRRLSPYFAMAAGGKLSYEQDLHLDLYDIKYPTNRIFVNPQLGLNVRTTTMTSLSFAVGLQCFTVPTCVEYTGYNATIRSSFIYGLDFHLGFTF